MESDTSVGVSVWKLHMFTNQSYVVPSPNSINKQQIFRLVQIQSKINVTYKQMFLLGRLENIAGKGFAF